MQYKNLNEYMQLILSASESRDWIKAKNFCESAVKNLKTFSYTPHEKYNLYCSLGNVYINLQEHTRSIEAFYSAYLTALKYREKQSFIIYAVQRIGSNLLATRNVEQALRRFLEVDNYYGHYGDQTNPMDAQMYVITLIDMAYCYLYKNEISKARDIVEKKLLAYEDILSSGLYKSDYAHIKGEYYMSAGEYDKARREFQECVKQDETLGYASGALEAEIHLATVDILEGKLDNAVKLFHGIMKNARRIKHNYIFCEAGLLLSKCYSLKNMSSKTVAVENGIKPVLRTLDIVWLYEQNRGIEQLFRRVPRPSQTVRMLDTHVPEVLSSTINGHRTEVKSRDDIVGSTDVVQSIHQLISKIAPTDLPVLIQGETGTGKELIARAIHSGSKRSGKTWLAFNCGALPESLLESELFGYAKGAFTGASGEKQGYVAIASGGTLFLDEISDMSPALQQKLLRVMEEKQIWRVGAEKPTAVDTRFVFASNQDIEQLVKKKLFREDLFFRINTIVINMPPLRERREDIPELVEHFMGRYSPEGVKMAVAENAMKVFMNYSWPGNVRELENEIKKICVINKGQEIIDADMISDTIRRGVKTAVMPVLEGLTMREMRDLWERDVIASALKKNGNNVSQSAKQLGYTRANLYKKMKQLKIDG
ncbi:MAG: sigma 54-interacting transcriptional regulator [Planctomycetes bacterium]|nr:sigma 54-interacting transcriptional regulator [Planctomycetota bacterium]